MPVLIRALTSAALMLLFAACARQQDMHKDYSNNSYVSNQPPAYSAPVVTSRQQTVTRTTTAAPAPLFSQPPATTAPAVTAAPVIATSRTTTSTTAVAPVKQDCQLTRWEQYYGMPCGSENRSVIVRSEHDDLHRLHAKPQVRTVVREQQAIIRNLGQSVYFSFDKDNIRPGEKQKLDALIADMSKAADVTGVEVFGHADRMGTVGYNEDLSTRRARQVGSYLVNAGKVPASKVQLRPRGERAPVTSCDSNMSRADLIACLAPDRRVDVKVELENY